MIKKLQIIIIFFVAIFFGDKVIAQQEQSFTHFMFQQAIYNPAVTGNEEAIQLNGLTRQQWVGISGAPETYFVNIQAPISFLNGGGGATIISDKIGPFNSTALKFSYAYSKQFWQGELSLGLSLGLINTSLNYTYFNVQDDPLLMSTDDESGMIFNVDMGLYYQEKNHFYFGLSTTQFNQGKMNLESGAFALKRNVYLHGGYFIKLRQLPRIVFHSSAMAVYTAGAPVQINLGIVAEYNKKFWGGVTYRHQSAISLLAGLYYKQFRVSYAYDINTTPLRNGGSHELMLGYRFSIEIVKGSKSYKNTRYL